MRVQNLAVPAALLLASGASAQPGNAYPSTDGDGIATVQVTAPFRLDDAEAAAVTGKYEMSNGWRMEVEPSSSGIEARINHRRPIRLVAVSADRFVSRDGNVSMDFNRGDDRDQMVMSYVPNPRLAIRYVVTAVLAQR